MAIRLDPMEDEVEAAISFLVDVQARLAYNPSVRGEFIGLLASFGRGQITDARAVAARAAALLDAYPDLLDRFNRFLAPNLASRLQDLKIQ